MLKVIYYMFLRLAKFTSKYKVYISVFWVALAVALIIFAPSLSKVGVTDDTQFLPQNTESTQAAALMKEKFSAARDQPVGSTLVVVYNPAGLSEANMQEARNLNDWLLSSEAPANVSRVISIFNNEALRSTLISRDQTAMLIDVDLSTASSSSPSGETVSRIRQYIAEKQPAAKMYVTGSAGVSNDALTSIQKTIDKATLVTVLLVVVLLLLIYRSPVAILVPLITIGISYLVARGVAGFIAVSGANVSSLVDAYLVVTLFGIGTDYCLFMVSRFKEEILQNNPKTAVELALKRIGPVILASATTVIVALLCLGISRFGMNRTSGYILAIGVGITLLAGLTLTPALISLFGQKLLWPARLKQVKSRAGGIWQRTGQFITRRPAVLILAIVILLVLPYLALPKIRYSADMLSQMPKDMGSVQGYKTVKEHFATGELYPVDVLMEYPQGDLTSSASRQEIENISGSLKEVKGVAQVRYVSTPASHLSDLSRQSREIGTNLSLTTATQLSFFQTLPQELTDLGVQYPGVVNSLNFQQIASNLAQASDLAKHISMAAPQNIPVVLEQVKPLIAAIADGLAGLSAEFNLQVESQFTQWLKSAYFSNDKSFTRLEIVLSTDPYASESITAIGQIREAMHKAQSASTFQGARYYVGGTSADLTDILAINGSDFLRVLLLSICGIILVTAILLRSIVAPLYMIATVLFNFGATLGIATWLFLDVIKQGSMIYMLPIFVFVILVAVGSDYNIFLVSRIREESHRKSLKEAVREAVANTGGVITSCGIILAGTFATLTTASLQMVFQVGAAIGIGVLIDTFLVRAVLIPSIATLAGRWNWWPSQLSRRTEQNPEK
jgi:putative drug exporter of the RND superfamily